MGCEHWFTIVVKCFWLFESTLTRRASWRASLMMTMTDHLEPRLPPLKPSRQKCHSNILRLYL